MSVSSSHEKDFNTHYYSPSLTFSYVRPRYEAAEDEQTVSVAAHCTTPINNRALMKIPIYADSKFRKFFAEFDMTSDINKCYNLVDDAIVHKFYCHGNIAMETILHVIFRFCVLDISMCIAVNKSSKNEYTN